MMEGVGIPFFNIQKYCTKNVQYFCVIPIVPSNNKVLIPLLAGGCPALKVLCFLLEACMHFKDQSDSLTYRCSVKIPIVNVHIRMINVLFELILAYIDSKFKYMKAYFLF